MFTRVLADFKLCTITTATRDGVTTKQYAHPNKALQEVMRMVDVDGFSIISDSGTSVVLTKDVVEYAELESHGSLQVSQTA